MQIIGHNSVNVSRIPTKLGSEIHCNEPFKYTKYQPIGACIGVLCWILRNVRNEEKTKKLKLHKNSQAVKNGAALKSLGEKSCEIKGGSQEMAAMMLMLINFKNGCFSFLLSIYSRCDVLASWATRYTTVFLDNWDTWHHFFFRYVRVDCRGAFQTVLYSKCCNGLNIANNEA